MQDNLKKLLKKEMTRKNFLHLIAVGIIGILGFGGVISYLLAHASTPALSEEAEDGTLNSNATVGSDSNASGGEYVKFGTAPSGGGSGSPVPLITGQTFSNWPISFDAEFNSMPTTDPGVIPDGWVLVASEQIAGYTAAESLASNVQIVNGKGLVIQASDTVSPYDGGGIATAATDPEGFVGFTVRGKPFYRDVMCTLPAAVNGQNANQLSSWCLFYPGSSSNGGEIDWPVTGWSNCGLGMELGNTSQYSMVGYNLGDGIEGQHTFSVYYDGKGNVSVWFDGTFLATANYNTTPPDTGNGIPDAGIEWFFMHVNQGAGPAGPNGATGPTVYGPDGEYVVAYDRIFVDPS